MMKKYIYLIVIFCGIVFPLYAETQGYDFNNYLKEFEYFFGTEESDLKKNGQVVLNLGSASSGRYAFNIRNVEFTIETRNEEPGCADICPPRTLLNIKCIEEANCIIDPSFPSLRQSSAIAELIPMEKGIEAYLFLLKLKEYFKQ